MVVFVTYQSSQHLSTIYLSIIPLRVLPSTCLSSYSVRVLQVSAQLFAKSFQGACSLRIWTKDNFREFQKAGKVACLSPLPPSCTSFFPLSSGLARYESEKPHPFLHPSESRSNPSTVEKKVLDKIQVSYVAQKKSNTFSKRRSEFLP